MDVGLEDVVAWDALPTTVWQHIASFLPRSDHSTARLVSRCLRDAVESNPLQLTIYQWPQAVPLLLRIRKPHALLMPNFSSQAHVRALESCGPRLSKLRFVFLSYSPGLDLDIVLSHTTNLRSLRLYTDTKAAQPAVMPALRSLEQLTVLDATGGIYWDAFKVTCVKSLEVLRLNGFDLTTDPLCLGGLHSLAHLTTLIVKRPKNPNQHLCDAINLLTQIKELGLHHFHLTEVPAPLLQLTGLQKLDLAHNFLPCLPDNITKLSSLQSLKLTSNALRYLPTTVANLRQLQTLDLRDNPALAKLPSALMAITSLTELYYGELRNTKPCSRRDLALMGVCGALAL